MNITSNDTHHLVDDRPLYVYVDNYIDKKVYVPKDQISVTQTPCGYKIVVAVESCRTATLVLPIKHGFISVGDEWGYINTNYPSKYYCRGPTNLIDSFGSEIIYGPIVHIINGETVCSCSVFGECLLSFCKDAYEQYVEVTGIPHNGEIVFYIDQSCNYKINLQRPVIQKRQTYYYDLLDLSDMNRAIYYGTEIIHVSANIDHMVAEVTNIQSILDQESIYSIITGSLAEQLNGINCSVLDCDFMLMSQDDILNAKGVLLRHGYAWQVDGINNPNLSNLKVGLSYDNYKIMSTHKHCEKTFNNLRFLSVEGLMLLSLLNCYEFHRSPYPGFYKKNDRTLLRLTKYAYDHSDMCNDKVARDIQKLSAFMGSCLELCQMISHVPVSYRDTRINEPFKVNCFENEDATYFSIINLGPTDHCRVVTPCDIKHAEWMDVSGEKKSCRIEDHGEFRLLYINDVGLPGVLTCPKS